MNRGATTTPTTTIIIRREEGKITNNNTNKERRQQRNEPQTERTANIRNFVFYMVVVVVDVIAIGCYMWSSAI